MMRALGLDVGEKRIGIARTDPTGTIAVPYEVYLRHDFAKDVEFLAKICGELGAEALVVGLPLNMDGTERAQANFVRNLAEAVATHANLPLFYVDERWTTKEVERAMRQFGEKPSRQKEKVDALSAMLILQAWLEQNKEVVMMQEFTFYLGNRPGALLEVAAALAEEKVNIEAIAALTVLEEAVVAMVTDAPDKTRKVLKKLGVDYEECEALALSLPHQPGQLATVLDRLARDGINVLSCYFSAEKNQILFTVDNLERAKAIFRL